MKSVNDYEFNSLETMVLMNVIEISKYCAYEGYPIPKEASSFLLNYFDNNKEIVARLIDGSLEILRDHIEHIDDEINIEDMCCSIKHWFKVNDAEYYKDYEYTYFDEAIKSIINIYKKEKQYN